MTRRTAGNHKGIYHKMDIQKISNLEENLFDFNFFINLFQYLFQFFSLEFYRLTFKDLNLNQNWFDRSFFDSQLNIKKKRLWLKIRPP